MHDTSLKKIGQTLILILIAFVPIFFLPSELISLDPLKIFLITSISFVSLLIIIAHKIKQNSFFLTKNFLVLSTFGVFTSLALSTFFSNNILISLFGRQITIHSLVGLLALGALAFAVHSFFDDIKSKTNLFATAFMSGVVLVVLHLVAIIFPFFPTLGFFFDNNVTTFGSVMDLGIFTVFMLLSSVLVLQYLSQSKLYKTFAWIGFISAIILLALLNSGLLFVLSTIFALLYIVFQVMSESGESKSISYHALAVFVLSILFLLIGGKVGMMLNSYFNVQADDVRPSLMSTLEVSQKVISNEPLLNKVFGVGINRFETAWLQYRPEAINQSQFWDTDFRHGYSYVLSTAVTQGIFGIFVWILFIISALYFVCRTLFGSKKDLQKSFLNVYVIFSFTFFSVMLLVSNPSFILLTFFFVFLGLFISLLKNIDIIQYKEFTITNSPRLSFVYILKLVLIVIAIIYGLYITTTQYVSRVMFDKATIVFAQSQDIDLAIQSVIRANFVYSSDIYNRALMNLGMLKLQSILQDQNLTQEQASDMFSEVLNTVVVIAQNTLAYDTQSYVTHLSILEIYKNLISFGVSDAQREALSIIDRMDTLIPKNPTSALERAQVYVLSREFDLATDQIQKALELKPNYTAAVFLLSQIQAEQGNIEEAIVSTRVLISANRFNSTLHFRLGLLYYNQSRYQDAIISFENALRLSQNFANARYFLGLSYYQNNRSTDGITVFENLVSVFPENTELKQILSNMRTGRNALEGIAPSPEQRPDLPLEDQELEENPDAELVEEDGQN